MGIDLVPLCRADLTMGEQVRVGTASRGIRVIAEIVDATLSGERLSAKLSGPASAEFVTADGATGLVDVRLTFETDDGAAVYMTYSGRLVLSADGTRSTIYVAPILETGDERYAWLNTIQVVGKGDGPSSELSYELYELR